MINYRFLSQVFLYLVSLRAVGQDFKTFKDYFTEKNTLTDVLALKTGNSFDQSGLSSEQIDQKIQKMLTNPVSELDIPINSKKLKYLGRKNPKMVIEFDSASYIRDMTMINKELEIYTYDGVTIVVSDQSAKNLMNVFFTARVLQILQFKYPDAYRYLISADQVELGYKLLNQGEFRPTLNKLIPIISFDKSPSKIAGSLWNKVWAKEPTRVYEGTKNYENSLNALTSINYETDRPKEIYGKEDAFENYYFYLREGLLESIAHEFTHHYISNFRNFDKKAEFIYNKRYDQQDKSFSFDVEEAIVINTTETYFLKKGGLSNTLVDFNIKIKYKDKKDKLQDLNDPTNKDRFERLKTFSNAGSFDDIYRLDFYK